MTQSEPLLTEINRSIWIVFIFMLVISLVWWDLKITIGVFSGGVVAVANHLLMRRATACLLDDPRSLSRKVFQMRFVFRLAMIGATIYVLLVHAQLNPFAVSIGLSVVVVSLFATAFMRLY